MGQRIQCKIEECEFNVKSDFVCEDRCGTNNIIPSKCKTRKYILKLKKLLEEITEEYEGIYEHFNLQGEGIVSESILDKLRVLKEKTDATI